MADHKLDTRFVSVLYEIGLKVKKPYYFEQNALFWSLNRLFSFYYRIVSVYNPKTKHSGDKDFLDADLESYIIRHRIILNDLGYILWQLLELFGISFGIKPGGGTNPRNRELSFFDFAKALQKNADPALDDLRAVVDSGLKDFAFMKDQRDNIAHYKSSIMIFGDGPDYKFAIMNSAGTMPTTTAGGTTKLVLKNVFKFTNDRHLFLWKWMNGELTDCIVCLCAAHGTIIDPSKFGVQMGDGAAISTFKEINSI